MAVRKGTRVFEICMVALLTLPLPGQAAPAAMNASPDTYLARLEALALVETLNAEILASRSATTTLEAWCRGHGMAAPATLKAHLVTGAADKPATPEQRQRLQVGSDEAVRYRRVQLSCGDHILSEAENWYVPSRLSGDMNQVLESTDTSFGRVVAPLNPSRQTFAATLLWRPLPEGWEQGGRLPDHAEEVLAIPPILFEHRAILSTAGHLPFSEVAEHYTREILAFRRTP